MKTLCALLLGATLFVSTGLSSAQAKSGWLTDLKQAQAEAKAQKKFLLADFTGSDWCGWCIKLDREVFSKPEFQKYASEHLVLLELDFPRGKKIEPTLQAQNQQLAIEQQVQGFPTVVVFNSEGRKVGVLGYMPGGPEAFIAELEKIRKN